MKQDDLTSQIETTANLLAQLEGEQADFPSRMTLPKAIQPQ
jgi:hypothetical protein